MTVETARVIFFAIAGVMWLVWIVGTRFALRRLIPARGGEPYGPGKDEAADAITGEASVAGDAESISKKLAGQIATAGASGAAGGAGLVKITERTAERIVFEKGAGTGAGLAFDEGLITLLPEGDRVRVRYAVSMKRFSKTMRTVTCLVCFVYGGAIVSVLPALLWFKVVQSDDEAVRWQVLQTLQMVHGVWPPFLVGFLSGRLRTVTARFFDTLVSNLEHTA